MGQGLDESTLQGGGVPLSFKVHAIWLKQPVGTKKGWQPPSDRGGITPARINDTEIPPPYVFTPRLQHYYSVDVCIPHSCRCGGRMDSRGLHGLSCKYSAGRFPNHSAMNDVIN